MMSASPMASSLRGDAHRLQHRGLPGNPGLYLRNRQTVKPSNRQPGHQLPESPWTIALPIAAAAIIGASLLQIRRRKPVSPQHRARHDVANCGMPS
jgi:hypothetical protein